MSAREFDLNYIPGSYWDDYDTDDPDVEDGVEIARIILASTLGDVYSVLATPDGERIRYRIDDGYGGNWTLSPSTSAGPLSFGALIRLIDDAWQDGLPYSGSLPDAIRDFQVENGSDPKVIVDFITVKSEFYPELEAYYDAQAKGWMQRQEEDSAAS